MQVNKKKCKGSGKCKGHGCNNDSYIFRYGLCKKCFIDWATTTEDGKELIRKSYVSVKRKVFLGDKKETRELKKSVARRNPKKEFYGSPAWRYCSRYVLLYYSVDGMVQCSTSGVWYRLPDKRIQAGHYLKSDQHHGTSFEFKNLAPQSYRDNIYFSGKPEIMKDWLIGKFGEGVIGYLNTKKNEQYKLDAFEYEKWKDHYKKLFDDLVKIKGNPWK